MHPPLDAGATLELAVLGVARQRPDTLPVLCGHVQALVAPWLTPTVEVVAGRVARLREAGWIDAAGSGSEPILLCTAAGAEAFAELMRRPLRDPLDATGLAGEVVKLACLDLLDSADAMAVAAELVAARRLGQKRLRQKLAGAVASAPAVARGLEHQLRLLGIAEEAVGAVLADRAGATA